MSEKWFKAEMTYRPKIVAVEVTKVTPKMIVYIDQGYSGKPVERQAARASDRQAFFPSWATAHDWLLEKADIKLQSARQRLARAQADHGNVKGMKPPAGQDSRSVWASF